MNLLSLKISHFRNYEQASFSFEPGCVHVFYGSNAQGKTNILEAIYYLSHLRSFRTSKTAALIEHGQPAAEIEGLVENKARQQRLTAQIASSRKQWMFGNPMKTSQFIGNVNAILFCPDDLSLFTASPKARRSFMDIELVKLSKSYTSTLFAYQKLLKERNQALKAYPVDSVLIDTFTDQMIEAQSVIIHQRYAFLQKLQELTNQILPNFKNNEQLRIEYKGPVDPEKPIKEQLKELYKKSRSRDLQTKSTSVGVHKDEVLFILNDHPLSQNASQGQKRTALLAIKLGLAEMIREKSGQYPILLLDDVFSELDPARKRHLIAQLPEEMQIFITSAEPVLPSWFDRKTRFYTVENGSAREGLDYE